MGTSGLATIQLDGNEVELGNSELESIAKITRDYEKNVIWLIQHYKELQSQYQDEYVAVYDQTLIGHAKKLNDLLEYVANQHVIDFRSMAIKKLSKRTEQLFLMSIAL